MVTSGACDLVVQLVVMFSILCVSVMSGTFAVKYWNRSVEREYRVNE